MHCKLVARIRLSAIDSRCLEVVLALNLPLVLHEALALLNETLGWILIGISHFRLKWKS